MSQARITRVRLENYKSIKFCDVQLEPITVLVGENGTGKSNFLDALGFTRDILWTSLDNAIQNRGNFNQITRNSDSEDKFLSISISFQTKNGIDLRLYFKVGLQNLKEKLPIILEEELFDYDNKTLYKVKNGEIIINHLNIDEGNYKLKLAISSLDNAKTLDRYEFLCFLELIQIIDPIPQQMRSVDGVYYGNYVSKSGSNFSSLLYRIFIENQGFFEKIVFYIRKINPQIKNITIKIESEFVIIDFLTNGGKSFNVKSISDGTLRALSLLTTLYFSAKMVLEYKGLDIGSLTAIEEPENGIHPAALSIILAAIRDVSDEVQVILTTHSPDLLEQIEIKSGHETVLIVDSINGETIIDEIDSASLEVVNRKLFDLGELLRMRQLEPKSLVGRDR